MWDQKEDTSKGNPAKNTVTMTPAELMHSQHSTPKADTVCSHSKVEELASCGIGKSDKNTLVLFEHASRPG